MRPGISRRSFLGLLLSSFGLLAVLPHLGWLEDEEGRTDEWYPGVYGLGPIE